MSKRKLVLRTPKKCIWCGSDKVVKKQLVMEHQMNGEMHNYLYNAICKSCHGTYRMREVYQEEPTE